MKSKCDHFLRFVNHFPNSSQITRKDLMALNWRKHKTKFHEPLGGKIHRKISHFSGDFVPETYVLPDEFLEFKKSFDSLPKDENIWILKPADRSRSIGIKLVTSLDEIPLFLKDKTK